MNFRQLITGITVLCLGTAMTGCSRSPQVNFYTLGTITGAKPAEPLSAPPAVSVTQISLPDLVDRPQLVERLTGNRVEILEMQRWAEPLKDGIARLLVDTLANRLASDLVTAYPQTGVREPDYKVTLDIRRLDATSDLVYLDAVWNVSRTSGGSIKTGRSNVQENRGREGYEALVAAYNRAIVSAGSDIVGAIRADRAAGQ